MIADSPYDPALDIEEGSIAGVDGLSELEKAQDLHSTRSEKAKGWMSQFRRKIR